MKKLLASLSMCLCLVLSACGGGGPAGDYTLDAKKMAEGMKPMFEKMPGTDKDKVAKALAEMEQNIKGDLKLEAEAWSLNMTMKMMGQTKDMKVKGTYKVDGENISMTGKEEGKDKEETITGTIKDGVITLTKDGQTMSFNKK